MKGLKASLGLLFSFLFLIQAYAQIDEGDTSTQKLDKILFTGKIETLHKEPIQEASIKVLVDGKEQRIMIREADENLGSPPVYAQDNEVESSSDGEYTAIIFVPANTATTSKITLQVNKPSYNTLNVPVKSISPITGKPGQYIHYENISPQRMIGPAFYISAFVLILIYVLISFDVFHRTLVALLGASILLFVSYVFGHFNSNYFILSFENAKNYIDFNVIFLLMGMMLIVGIMKRTGVFQWLAFKSYQIAKGDVWKLAVILMIVTAIVSAFLDNVTTMLLLTPVSIEIALVLRINPWSLLLPEVLASNLGGTATLIGDPPNIMIGSYANLTFVDFLIGLTPVVILSMIALIFIMKFYYKSEYKKANLSLDKINDLLKKLQEEYKITNLKLLRHSLTILGFVIFLFVVHGIFHMEPSIPALIGAALLMISAVFIDKMNVAHLIEREIEWPTLVFFIMLYIIVGAAVETGLIQMIAEWVARMSEGNFTLATIIIVWVSAISSAIIDNIPFTATMLPIVGYLTQAIPNSESIILWWALALGACFGGNGTLIGASANVVTAGLAEKSGHPISFVQFFKVGFPAMIATVIISTLYLVFIMPHLY